MENDNRPNEHAAPDAPAPDPNAVIEQVRELLFGDNRRATEAAMKALEDRMAALNATLEARFSDLERRLQEARQQGDSMRESNVAAIGSALMELGERIKSLIPNTAG